MNINMSRRPEGSTLLKRRVLQLLGHTLVSVPYWEWDACEGADERKKYLRGKFEALVRDSGRVEGKTES
jgi:hypothetical protein